MIFKSFVHSNNYSKYTQARGGYIYNPESSSKEESGSSPFSVAASGPSILHGLVIFIFLDGGGLRGL